MERSKIQLSQDELMLVQNPDILLTKNHILRKVNEFFGLLAEHFQHRLKLSSHPIVQEAGAILPKISRGENYKGLPYLILDYPRQFTRENVFAIRTMFWWGNFFSITLHLKGDFKQLFTVPVFKSTLLHYENNFFISYSGDEWEHDATDASYHPSYKYSNQEWIEKLHQSPFIKLTAILPLNEWTNAEEFLNNKFEEMIKMIEG